MYEEQLEGGAALAIVGQRAEHALGDCVFEVRVLEQHAQVLGVQLQAVAHLVRIRHAFDERIRSLPSERSGGWNLVSRRDRGKERNVHGRFQRSGGTLEAPMKAKMSILPVAIMGGTAGAGAGMTSHEGDRHRDKQQPKCYEVM